MNPIKQAAGLATLQKYGHEYYSAIGKLGGRPRRLTADDILRQQAAAEQKHEKEEVPLRRLSLAQLRRLYLQRQLQRSCLETVQNAGPAGV